MLACPTTNFRHYLWANSTGDGDDGDDVSIWYGETRAPEILDLDFVPWQPLYHEEDYRGISDQLKAEDLEYDTI